MALLTTAIGAFPKPNQVDGHSWFDPQRTTDGSVDEATLARATRQAVIDQVDAGVDIPTDGEVGRENYIHYHCRNLDGFDFEQLEQRSVRNGAWTPWLPTITGPITRRESFLPADFARAQAATTRPVKITMPGPMTIIDTTANVFYTDEQALGLDLVDALRGELIALAAAGCTNIQIDEPVMARYPSRALSYGFDLLESIVVDVDASVALTLHVCCGYPDRLDNPDYRKADARAYFDIAARIEASRFDVVSIEDAHRHNELELFDMFETITVALGVVDIARSRVEDADTVRSRLETVLSRVPSDRLILAPDCGLGMLDRETAIAKLRTIRMAADEY